VSNTLQDIVLTMFQTRTRTDARTNEQDKNSMPLATQRNKKTVVYTNVDGNMQ